MLSTLVHKLITLLLYYGMNLVVIFENFYSFAVRQVGQEPSNPWTVIFILSGIYVFAGLAAAAAGYTLGRKARKEPPETHLQVRSVEMPPLFEGEALNFSRLRLFFHVLMIPAGLFLLNSLPVVWGLSFVFFYVLLCLFYYPSLKKRLFRPGIWVQLMLIILLASFFIDNLMNNGKEISLAGLREGIKMSFRAVLVFTGFSAFGAEIRNPVIRNFMIRRGFANLYTALSLSFSILPGMIEGLTTPAEFFRNPFRSVKAMLVRAESWLGTVKTRDLRE